MAAPSPPWHTPPSLEEERSQSSQRSLLLRRSFSDHSNPLSPTKHRQRSGSANVGDASSPSPEGQSEGVTPGTLREELSKLVDGIAGEDGRIRLADFNKLSGCSAPILAALEMKLPRQTSWEASQVKEVLLNEMSGRHTPPPSPVSRQEPVPNIVRSPAPLNPASLESPERSTSVPADLGQQAQTPRTDLPTMAGTLEPSPAASPLHECLAPPPPSPTSITPSSPLALTPAVARTPISLASSSPRSRAQTPHELLAAAAAAFQSVVPRLRLERLRRDTPISADFMVSAPVVTQPASTWPSPKLSVIDTQGGVREGTQGDSTSRTAASALQVPGADDGLASAEDLRLLMKRAGSPRHSSAIAPSTPFLGSSTPSGGRLSGMPGEGGASGTTEPPWPGRARAHTVMVPGRGVGMHTLEQLAQASRAQDAAAAWLAPDLREVAALLRQGEWHRGVGGPADKVGDCHEYVGHGQSARYFERLDNVMEGDSMEQLVKRAKRKAFLYIQNTFKLPDSAPDGEPLDSVHSLAPPTEGSARRRSNSLWSRLSPARVREAGLEWARKDSFASTMSNAPSVASAVHKSTEREEHPGTVRDDGASVCTAADSAETQTKSGGKGDDPSKHHAEAGEGIYLDPARATQLKTTFLQMADFYLSICYHLGSLFSKEKEKNFEDRQHLQDMLDRYKEKIQVAEQKLMLNFELAQQQREQLDALERDINARDEMDRRREGLLNELQGRLKKQHEVHMEELRKRDEEAEDSLRQCEALRRKFHRVSEDYESLLERLDEAEERIGSLTAAAAKRSGTNRSDESAAEALQQETKASLADEVASLLAPPPGSFTRTHTPPGRRNDRPSSSRVTSFHKWSARKTEAPAESAGVSLLEEIQQSGSDMQLPQVNEKESSSSESEPERSPSSKEPEKEVLLSPPPPVEVPEEVPDGHVPALPPPPSPESPRLDSPVLRASSRQLRRLLLLQSLSASDEPEKPPPPKPVAPPVSKTVVKRIGNVARPAFVRKWRELTRKHRQPVPPTRQLSTEEKLDLWEAEVTPEEPPVSVKVPVVVDLALMGALGSQALRLQMGRWQKRCEKRRKRPVLSVKSLFERLLSSRCLPCSPCSHCAGVELPDDASERVHLSAPLGRSRLSTVSVQA
ncbi:hypothetical protein CSUI_005025 [Cystoisospora suis]|uniref:Uncharacterized protein n=1 Tax=Cystoisospora suis TaxID=483139 RepID=A0A2C6KV77_9APIC|nr:hypothetical protein CSUI_005025 [Cystoisospora suis]